MNNFISKLRAARARASSRDLGRAYYSAALWALRPIETPGLSAKAGGPVAVDPYWRLYYDPESTDTWTVENLAAALIHEVMHLVRLHYRRGISLLGEQGLRKHGKQWNRAGDAEINPNLRDLSLPTIEKLVWPKKAGLKDYQSAEWYYENWPEGPDEDAGTGSAIGAGECGSCADGEPREWELGPPKAKDGSDGVTEAKARQIQRVVAEAVRNAAKGGSGIGRGPSAGEVEWSKDLLEPQVHWTRHLSGEFRRCLASVRGCFDYSYSRPSRRQSAFGNIIIPSMQRPQPVIDVVIDTSGSMYGKRIGSAMSEVKGLFRQAGAAVSHVISCDAEAQNCQRVWGVDAIKLKGGGGTDMGQGIAYAEALRPRPDIIVVVTDGESPWPEKRPRAKVIVCLVSDYDLDVPSWATKIRVGDEKSNAQSVAA